MNLTTAWILAALLSAPVAASDVFTTLDYADAFAKAQADGLLLIVDATADWCPPCKKMESETWPKPSVIDALSGVALAVQIDVDESPSLAQQLEIRAMPTIIAIRDGKEVDRHVGYLGAKDFLKWFDAVKQGVNVTETERQALVDKDAALLAGTDENARYDQAGALQRLGEHERALAHYLWLWEHIGPESVMRGVRSSFMISDIKDLIAQHPPAAEPFAALRDVATARIAREPGAQTWRQWDDWLTLDAMLDDSAQVRAWFDTVTADGGALPEEVATGSVRVKLQDQLVKWLIEEGRWEAAARLGADLRKCASDDVAIYKIMSQSGGLSMVTDEQGARMMELRDESLRESLATYYAVALLAGETDDAAHISGRLLDLLDDADSRVTLVRAAITARAPAAPQLSTWLDEAAAVGEPVGELRKRLEQDGG